MSRMARLRMGKAVTSCRSTNPYAHRTHPTRHPFMYIYTATLTATPTQATLVHSPMCNSCSSIHHHHCVKTNLFPVVDMTRPCSTHSSVHTRALTHPPLLHSLDPHSPHSAHLWYTRHFHVARIDFISLSLSVRILLRSLCIVVSIPSSPLPPHFIASPTIAIATCRVAHFSGLTRDIHTRTHTSTNGS